MNILFARTDIKMAGPGVVMLKTARALSDRGHSVSVISSGGELHREFIGSGIESCIIEEFAINRRGIFDLIKAVAKARKAVKGKGVNVIHGHNLVSTLLMSIACLFCKEKINFYTTIHGVGKEKFFKYAPGKLIAVSKFVKDRLVAAGVPGDKVVVIYNGFIDLNVVPIAEFHNEETISKDKRVEVVSVAMMTKFKGHRRVIDTFNVALQEHDNMRLTLIGDGVERQSLTEYVEQLGLTNKIVFLGARSDVPIQLSQADILIHAPDSETFGMVVLEAMASGLAVLTSRVGGIPELVTDMESGCLVENNIAQLSERLVFLAKQPEVRRTLGINAKGKVEKSFNFVRVMNSYENLYKSGEY